MTENKEHLRKSKNEQCGKCLTPNMSTLTHFICATYVIHIIKCYGKYGKYDTRCEHGNHVYTLRISCERNNAQNSNFKDFKNILCLHKVFALCFVQFTYSS